MPPQSTILCCLCGKALIPGQARYTAEEPEKFQHYECRAAKGGLPDLNRQAPAKRRAAAGAGPIAEKLAELLAVALSEETGLAVIVSASDFWLQRGDYRKNRWDLERWGADIPHPHIRDLRLTVYSWGCMRDCLSRGIEISPDGTPFGFEVFPK